VPLCQIVIHLKDSNPYASCKFCGIWVVSYIVQMRNVLSDVWCVIVLVLSVNKVLFCVGMDVVLGFRLGARGGVVVEALCYKLEGHGINYRWCHWNSSWT
jgi:hypothetical protein